MKRKIFLLCLVLIFMAISAYGLVSSLTFVNPVSKKSVQPKLQEPSPFRTLLNSTLLKCPVSDSIDYLEYKSKSPDHPKNNKFGLYIYAENSRYIRIADELVNSNGGDWGYVLIPYNIRDRDRDKWERVFNDLHKRHLIPVLQLNDIRMSTYREDTMKAARFLNSFVWPVRERYVSVYNEPNDDKFWLGKASPSQYAEVLDVTVDIFKAENNSFFMLNGALNASAPNNANAGYISAESFMRAMNIAKPGVFNQLDGWASHPYPQPNFSGSPKDTGWWSIRAYEEELRVLKDLGVKKHLPVFITETGWAHAEGNSYNNSYHSAEQIGEYFKQAYEDVWLQDPKVRAVMPFTVYYNAPFDHFSWVTEDYTPYAHFDIVKKIKKTSGTPFVVQKSVVSSFLCL